MRTLAFEAAIVTPPGTDFPPERLPLRHRKTGRVDLQVAPAHAATDVVHQRTALRIGREGPLHGRGVVEEDHIELLQVFGREFLLFVVEHRGEGASLFTEQLEHDVDRGNAPVNKSATYDYPTPWITRDN